MTKLKKYHVGHFHFVLFLTFLLLLSCTSTKIHPARIEGKNIGITSNDEGNQKINNFIEPYREHIDTELGAVLANAPQPIDKNGQWQTPMGNLFSQAVFEEGNPIFQAREHKSIDFVFLNHGGIRTIIPQGNVTARTAFEIMPFENSLVVIELKTEQVEELLHYFINEKKPHPIYGLTFTIGKDNSPKDVLIQGKPLLQDATYLVGTNDYLANGGDNMGFFKKGIKKYDLDYKLRNILIDYFKRLKVLPLLKDQRVSIDNN